ncbi:unnamed protein product, partial [Rhizoctonia solani]
RGTSLGLNIIQRVLQPIVRKPSSEDSTRDMAIAHFLGVRETGDGGGACTCNLGEVAEDFAHRALVLFFWSVGFVERFAKYTTGLADEYRTLFKFPVDHFFKVGKEPTNQQRMLHHSDQQLVLR